MRWPTAAPSHAPDLTDIAELQATIQWCDEYALDLPPKHRKVLRSMLRVTPASRALLPAESMDIEGIRETLRRLQSMAGRM